MSDSPEMTARKSRRGLDSARVVNQDELLMAAEESLSKSMAWCIGCDRHMPVKEMKLITRSIDAYKQIDEGPTDYISKLNRVRMCPKCFDEEYGKQRSHETSRPHPPARSGWVHRSRRLAALPAMGRGERPHDADGNRETVEGDDECAGEIMNTETITEPTGKLTPKMLLRDWPERIANFRLSEESCRKQGHETLAKWYEGQADALERCHSELQSAAQIGRRTASTTRFRGTGKLAT